MSALADMAAALVIAGAALWGVLSGTDVFQAMLDGVAEGLRTLLRIFPSLVALLTAVYMLRASGALELLTHLLSPLLGLLGTVLGMLTVFKVISTNAAPDATMLAAGIWEALITTVMGLTVAIPMLMFHYYLKLFLKGYYIQTVECTTRIMAREGLVKKRPAQAGGTGQGAREADNA